MDLPLIQPFATFPLICTPPYTLTCSYLSFWLPCDASLLASQIDSTFGWAAPEVTISALPPSALGASTVLAIFCAYDTARAAGPDGATGSTTYNELSIFVPVNVHPQNGAPYRALHMPYLYLDDAQGMAEGREVYGMPKKPATLAIPSWQSFTDGAPATVSVKAIATAGEDWAPAELLRISAVKLPGDALLPEIPIHLQASPGVLALTGTPLVQLKQVPSTRLVNGTLTSVYRAVVQVPPTTTSLSVTGLLSPPLIQFKVAPLLTDPLSTLLGAGGTVSTIGETGQMGMTFAEAEILVERFAPKS